MRALSFKNLLLSGAAFALCSFAQPALADECSNTTYVGVYSNYPYQDFGQYGSEQPVAQGGHTVTCGNWSFDGWLSAGKRDENQGANEGDLSVTYAPTFDVTPVGPINAAVSVAYYAFDFDGLGHASDDAYQLSVDVARPFSAGDVTVSPFVRASYVGFVNGSAGLNFVQPGLRFEGQISERLSYSAEFSVSMNRTQGIDTNRFQGDLNYDLGDGWSLNGRVKLTEGLDRPTIGGGASFTW